MSKQAANANPLTAAVVTSNKDSGGTVIATVSNGPSIRVGDSRALLHCPGHIISNPNFFIIALPFGSLYRFQECMA